MTDREKLIELLLEVDSVCGIGDCAECVTEGCFVHRAVDHLIANGVVIREKVEWKTEDYDSGDPGYYSAYLEVSCKKCGLSVGVEQGQYDWYYGEPFPWNFCPNCGADMR